MPLKNKLNQYELDTALAVLRCKALPLHTLKNKTVAVSGGGELHKAILYSLLYLNEAKDLQIKVVSVGESVPKLYDDDEFSVKDPEELGSCDYFIECGFLRWEGEADAQTFSRAIDRALASAGPMVYQIQLIHGYHRGTSLRSKIQEIREHPGLTCVIPGKKFGEPLLPFFLHFFSSVGAVSLNSGKLTQFVVIVSLRAADST